MKKERSKFKKFLLGVLYFISTIVFIVVVLNVIPPKKAIKENPFVSKDRTMAAAHRGGGYLNPENTLKAYKYSREIGCDILECDLRTTKDGVLVVNHDDNLTRTSDATLVYDKENPKVGDFTLEELQQLNFGYNFKDLDGNTPYKHLVTLDQADRKEVIEQNEIGILTLEMLLEQFYDTDKNILFILEIKEKGEKGKNACDRFVEIFETKYPDYLDNFVLGTFHHEIDEYLKTTYPNIMRGASQKSVTKFVITQMLGVNIFENTGVACLQLPMEQYGVNLAKKSYIRRANRKNIAVQYWTINDRTEMEKLIAFGADAIITDNPQLLLDVLSENK